MIHRQKGFIFSDCLKKEQANLLTIGSQTCHKEVRFLKTPMVAAYSNTEHDMTWIHQLKWCMVRKTFLLF